MAASAANTARCSDFDKQTAEARHAPRARHAPQARPPLSHIITGYLSLSGFDDSRLLFGIKVAHKKKKKRKKKKTPLLFGLKRALTVKPLFFFRLKKIYPLTTRARTYVGARGLRGAQTFNPLKKKKNFWQQNYYAALRETKM